MIELLPLQIEHCEAVAEIAKESLPEHWSLSGVQDVLNYDNNIFYVAYCPEDSAIVGFAGIMLITGEAELLNIAIRPVFRGRGIGQKLLDKMISEAFEKGAYRMLLEVRRSNEAAIHLYSRNQFVKLGERKNYYSNPPEDAVIMERKI